MPNDALARSPTGEILEPSQIQTPPPVQPQPTPPPASTSTPTTPAAPEAYTDFKAPDNYTIDKATIDAATPIFKELGLSQDQAQRLVDFHTQQMIAAAKAPETEYAATRIEWVAKAKSDPDIAKAVNGDKTGLEAVRLDMGRALNAIGDPALTAEFKAAMDLTGAGDHPAFIKTFWKMAQFITEGKHVGGDNPSIHGQTPPGQPNKPSAAQALYPNLS